MSSVKIVYYHPKSQKLRECLVYIADWSTKEGAKLYLTLKHKSKSYSNEDLDFIGKANISIAKTLLKDNLASCVINEKGLLDKIPYKVLKKLIKSNKEVQKADLVEILEKEFKVVHKYIEKIGTLYCDISVSLYKLKPKIKEQPTLEEQIQSTQETENIIKTPEEETSSKPSN